MADGQADEHEIENVVLRDAELLGPAQAVRHGEQHADGNDDAVEFDLEVCSRMQKPSGGLMPSMPSPGKLMGLVKKMFMRIPHFHWEE